MMKSNLSNYLIEMVSDDIYYDEANPKYRCFWNKFHVVKMTKIIILLHICLYTLTILCRLPYSVISVPITLLIFVPSVYGIKNERCVFLFPLLLYLVFCTIVIIFFGISVFAVCFVDYHSFLIFIGRTDIHTLAGKIGLIIFTKCLVIGIALFFAWQCRVVSSCRQFFHDKLEQKRYMHTAIPENLPAIVVKPEVTRIHKLTPEYLPFTLE